MDKELSLYELGILLKEITSKYKTSLVTKVKMSGGWMTFTGNIEVEYIPKVDNIIGGNNIIGLRVCNNVDQWTSIKITGIKGKKFNINIAKAKYKEINKFGLNIDQIKEKEDKSTLRIDDSMVLSVDAGIETLLKILD